jgi:hypothetical protein
MTKKDNLWNVVVCEILNDKYGQQPHYCIIKKKINSTSQNIGQLRVLSLKSYPKCIRWIGWEESNKIPLFCMRTSNLESPKFK